MVKSVWVVLAIGAGGFLLTSLVMRKALQVQQEHRSELEFALERRFQGLVVPPVHLQRRRAADGTTAIVHLRVRGGRRPEPVVDAAGQAVWDHLRGRPDAPVRVTVVVTDDVGSAPHAFDVPPPAAPR
ncbi:MAG: hypothetical protein U1E73_06515 [Planctomycetota bacterium]